MILKLLCITVIVAALVQESSASIIFPGFENDDASIEETTTAVTTLSSEADDVNTEGTSSTTTISEFEADDVNHEGTSSTTTISEFQDDDVNTEGSSTTIVCPEFENDNVNIEENSAANTVSESKHNDVTDNPNEGKAILGDEEKFNANENDDETNGGQQTPGGKSTGGNKSPIELRVSKNNLDSPVEVKASAQVGNREEDVLTGLFYLLGKAIHSVVNENTDNLHKDTDSVLKVAQSGLHVTKDIVDSKMKAFASIPRILDKFFKELKNIKTKE